MNQSGTVAEALLRPTLLITGAQNFMLQQQWTRKTREQAFFDTVIPCLRSGNPILIPVEASSRVFEVAYVLDNQWNKTKSQIPIVFMSHVASRTMQFAKSMIEWMGEDVNAAFSKNRDNPIEFRSIKAITSHTDLMRVNPTRVVLASLGSLDYGFSRELLLEFCKNPKSSIVLPSRGQPGTLQRLIYDEWVRKSGWKPERGDSAPPQVQLDTIVPLTIRRKVPLQGEELLAHLRELQMKREQEEAEEANRLREEMLVLQDDEDESDDDSRPDTDDVRNPLLARFDAYVKEISSSKAGGGAFFRGQQAFRMFPASENRKRFDDYGEIINPEDYVGKEFHFANMEAIRSREDKVDTEEKVQESKIPEIPTKFEEEQFILELKCSVRYVDFEGETDGRSIRNILPQILPKKMVCFPNWLEC
jgi:cleavage and polyadenylation specificity factor subunit 2